MCKFCSKHFSGSVMGQHIQSCRARIAELEREAESFDMDNEVFLIKVSGESLYWLFLEIDKSATLEELDAFLRNIWLECCGHLSLFTINGINYERELDPDFPDSKSMKVRIGNFVRRGTGFEYEYDYGTATHLKLKVISSRTGTLGKNPIQLIARNDPYAFKCTACGKEAQNICTQCLWETSNTFFCDKCIKKHNCGEDVALPVVNSPRMGMCGYTGDW